MLCRQLGFTKQAFYKSKVNQQIALCHQSIVKQKVLSIRQKLPKIGTRKLYYILQQEFKQQHIQVGRDKLFSLLREENLLIKKQKRYVKTTNSKHWMHKYPNLIKSMRVVRPEQIWVADITYIAIENGFAYLHLITDAYSKKIMGYCISHDLTAAATKKSLEMALSKRQYAKKLIHHSDRGLQYSSSAYTNVLKKENISISMTQDGSPYDNAIAERVNGILKDEFDLYDTFLNIKQAQKQTDQAIFLYNNCRPHFSCSMLTPEQMHKQSKLAIKTWEKQWHE